MNSFASKLVSDIVAKAIHAPKRCGEKCGDCEELVEQIVPFVNIRSSCLVSNLNMPIFVQCLVRKRVQTGINAR